MEQTAEWDSGRTQMEYIMKKKAEAWKRREECIASKTCPEQLQQAFEGAFVCDETGMLNCSCAAILNSVYKLDQFCL